MTEPAMLSDPARLAALRGTGLLDSEPEESFDRVTRLVRRLLEVPVALVTLLDADRQFFKSAQGLPEPVASARQTPLSHAFCQHVVRLDEVLAVEDARQDPRLAGNLAIAELKVIAYLGVPLKLGQQVLGSLCAIDHQPRRWREEDVAVLSDLAATLGTELELRASERRFRALQQAIPDGFMLFESVRGEGGEIVDFRWCYTNPAAERLVGRSDAELRGKRLLTEMPGNAEEGLFDAYKRVVETGEPWQRELHYPREGVERWLRVTASKAGDGFAVAFSDISEAKRAEADRVRLAAIVTSSDDAILSKTLDGIITTWNDGARRIFGYSAEEMVGQSIMRLVPEERREEEEGVLGRLRRGERIATFETVRLGKNGRPIEVSLSVSPMRDASGTILGASSIFHDIGERKHAEAALRQSEEHLRRAFASGRMGSWEWDFASGRVSLGGLAAELWGLEPNRSVYPREALMARIHPEDAERVRQAVRQSAEGKGDYEEEFRVNLPQGGQRWLLGKGEVVFEGGKPARMVGVHFDITERKLAEARVAYLLRTSKVLGASLDYGTTLQRVADLTVPSVADWCALDLLEPGGALELVAVAHQNPAKVKLARELRRRYPVELSAEAGIARVLRTGEPEFLPEITEEMLMQGAQDDEQLAVLRQIGFRSALTVPLVAREKVLGALTLVWSDSNRSFTEADVAFAEELAQRAAVAVDNARLYREAQDTQAQLLRLNQVLEQLVRERTLRLETINHELEAFNYSVSHDLRAPLRGIDGFSQALAEEYGERLDETGLHYLSRIRSAAQRMGELIDDLLNLSRLSRSEMTLDTVNLSELAADVVQSLHELEPARAVTARIAPGLFTWGDRRMMKIALENLIGNAWKFTQQREGAEITFGRSREGAYFVRDNGAGFNMAYAEKLFAPFQRLHAPGEFAGSGIGLATVQRVIHRHGGKVWAESEEGKGATFYFTLPKEGAKL